MTSPGSCPLCGATHDAPTDAFKETGFALGEREMLRHVCPECLSAAIQGEPQLLDDLDDALIRETLPRIVEIVGEAPWRSWLPFDRHEQFSDDELLELLEIGRMVPPMGLISDAYGGWANVLHVAGFGDVPPPSSRGIRSTANDGHSCFSQGERLIDDWFDANGVEHTREPPYPGGRFRGDFLVGDNIVEFFGLAGQSDYDARMGSKAEAARRAGVTIVGVYPDDLLATNWGGTQQRLAEQLGFEIVTAKAAPRQRPQQIDMRLKPLGPFVPPWVTQPCYDVEPGYYSDPYGSGGARWNDGTAWTYRVVVSGTAMSETPGIASEEREWIASRFRHSERAGGLLAAGRNWAQGLMDALANGPFDPSMPPLKERTIHRLAAWIDLAENSQHHVDEWPYEVAAAFFSVHRMRSAEAAVHARYESRFRRPLESAPHSALALRRRGHLPDDTAALFAIRGAAPAGDALDLDPSTSSSSVADDDYQKAVWSFLEAIGVEDIVDVSGPGSSVHLLSDDAAVYLHGSELLRKRDLKPFAGTAVHGSLTRVAFFRGEVSSGAREFAVGEGIGCFRLDPPGKPMPVNWDASGFFDDHSEDESLVDSDPDFFVNN